MDFPVFSAVEFHFLSSLIRKVILYGFNILKYVKIILLPNCGLSWRTIHGYLRRRKLHSDMWIDISLLSVRSNWSTCKSNPLFLYWSAVWLAYRLVILLGFLGGRCSCWEVVQVYNVSVWIEFRSPYSQGKGFTLTKLSPQPTLLSLFYRQGVEGDKQMQLDQVHCWWVWI